MKVFWALILVLVASAGILLAMRSNDRPTDATTLTTAEARVSTGSHNEPSIRTQPESGPPEATKDATPINLPPDSTTNQDQPDNQTATDESTTVEIGMLDTPTDATTDTTDSPPLADDTTDDNQPPTSNDPNTLILNDRYPVKGNGTAESPYILSFDALVAVEQDYAPKQPDKKTIPEWIKTLDGKHVSITGFVAFPFLAASADECMVMLNQWDGCCIGVPPTPYDAVEVQFATPLDLNRGIPNYGTLTGVFHTDPYLVNGWLIGLYVMDNATLTNSGSKNQSGF